MISVIQRKSRGVLNLLKNIWSTNDIYYIAEGGDWVIKNIGCALSSNLKACKLGVTESTKGIRNSIIHFGSINPLLANKNMKSLAAKNNVVVTCFHITPGDDRVNRLGELDQYVDMWHTACSLTLKKLCDLGIPSEKIALIPLGIDLNKFTPCAVEQREEIRTQLGIPSDKTIIGSFQKDGNGWGEGLEPKLIKGPDIFCDVVEKIAKEREVFVLLTGPARGYVKSRLTAAGIPFKHDFLDDPDGVAEYFKAIDLYIIAAREEGGPKAVLESWACGVPLVSTKVGMCIDIVKNNENGYLCEIEDVDALIDASLTVLSDSVTREKLIVSGEESIKQFGWSDISRRYYKDIYEPTLFRDK